MLSSEPTVEWLGEVDYPESLILLNRAVEKVANRALQTSLGQTSSDRKVKTGFIYGCSHSACITLGRSASMEAEVLADCSLPVYQTERGGRATVHSPGQLVIYPILDIRKIGVRQYVADLLETSRECLAAFGIETQVQSTGLHTENGKIASVGVRVRRGVSSHGVAVNISNDLHLFESIQTCGVRGAAVDRCANHFSAAQNKNEPLHPEDFFLRWSQIFIRRCHA